MFRAWLVLLTAIFSPAVVAQLDDRFADFIRAEDPEVLGYWYSHDDACPWEKGEVTNLIEGIIKRSRIKPEPALGLTNGFYLNIDLACLEASIRARSIGYMFEASVMYGDYPMLYEREYGALQVFPNDNPEYGFNNLRSYIEDAVTDFIEVNFLSSED